MLMAGPDQPCPGLPAGAPGRGSSVDHTQARLWQEGRRAQCDGGWATSLRRMSQPEPATVARARHRQAATPAVTVARIPYFKVRGHQCQWHGGGTH
jgi:hypothetical protein